MFKPEQPPKQENLKLKWIFDLIEKEKLDLDYTFPLQNEKDQEGDQIKGQAAWIKIKETQDDKVVEGKLYKPEQDSETLIIFAPGMPGDGTTWFEDKHVNTLLQEGNTIFTVRHNGTRLDNPKAMNYVHSQERIEKGLENNQENLGEQKIYSLEETAREYETALKALGNKFEKIKLIGHSSGVPNLSYAITFLPKEIQDKITNFVGLAGFIGKYRDTKNIFGPQAQSELPNFKTLLKDPEAIREYYEFCNQFLNLGNPQESVKDLKKMLETVYNYNYPNNISYVLAQSSHDEYIPPSSANDLQEHLQRGLVVTETTNQISSDREAHDLEQLTPNTLSRFLKVKTSSYKHSLKVNSTVK